MSTLRELADYLDKLADSVPQIASQSISSEVAEVMLTYLLRETPVDTGVAISNWRVSLNVPDHEIIPAYFPGSQGSTQIINQQAALEVAQTILLTKKPGDTIYISNPLPYIESLNGGSSTQSPGGFVEGAQQLGRLYAENPLAFEKGFG